MLRGTDTRPLSAASVYPDVLGFISGDVRLTVDAVQAALSIYPRQAAVGQPFEALLLLQNLTDQQVTVKITIQLPRRNTLGERLSLFTPRDSLEFPIQAGEVGLLHLPVRAQLPTPVGQRYPVAVHIEAPRPRNARFIRDATGGRAPGTLTMSAPRLAILQHDVRFTAHTSDVPSTLRGAFDILPGQIGGATSDLAPRYEPLWSAKQLMQDQAGYSAVEAETRELTQRYSRADLYDALQDETMRRFNEAGLPLLPGETLAIAKLLTYVLEDGLEIEPGFSLTGSRWFQRLTLFRGEPALLADTERLVARLYTALIHDAGRLGYMLLNQQLQNVQQNQPGGPARFSRSTKPLQSPLGLPEDQAAHLAEIVDALDGRLPLNWMHVYLPLALAGVLLHVQIKGPKENVWATLNKVREAWQWRDLSNQPYGAAMAAIMTNALQNAEQFMTRMRVPRS